MDQDLNGTYRGLTPTKSLSLCELRLVVGTTMRLTQMDDKSLTTQVIQFSELHRLTPKELRELLDRLQLRDSNIRAWSRGSLTFLFTNPRLLRSEPKLVLLGMPGWQIFGMDFLFGPKQTRHFEIALRQARSKYGPDAVSLIPEGQ